MKQQIRPKQQEEIKDNYFYQLKDNIFQRDFRVDYIFDKDNISVGEGDLILENTENPKFSRFGNKSLKLNINSDENITLNFNFNETKDFSDRIITLWFYIPNEYNVNGLQNVINQEALYLNDGYFSHWGEQNLNRKTGWNYFNMDLGSITDYNTLNLTNLKEVINGRIRLYPNINENFEIYIDSIVSWKAPNFPAIKISFDDWRESVTTNAFPAMVERGIRGCNYPYTDVIGTTETRNPEILLQMERAGWDICSHSKSHPRMSELSNEEIEFELKQSQKDLLDLGLKNGPQFYIAPYGDCAPYAIEYSKKIYKAYRRTGYSKKGDTSIVVDPYAMECVHAGTYNLEWAKNQIDRLVETNGFLEMMWHDQIGEENWPLEDFEEFLDYVLEKNIKVITYTDQFPNSQIKLQQ